MLVLFLIVTTLAVLWFVCGSGGVALIEKIRNPLDPSNNPLPYWLVFVCGLAGLMAGIMIYLDQDQKKNRRSLMG